MNLFAAWTGVRRGGLMAVEGWDGEDSPLQLSDGGISIYAVDWRLRELGGRVRKAPPKEGSYRLLDLPPFLPELMRWAMKPHELMLPGDRPRQRDHAAASSTRRR